MTKEMIDQYYANIEASNEAFKAMTREQKRVQIAQDVLQQMKIGKVRPMSAYVWFDALHYASDAVLDSQLQDLLRRAPTCDACAIGVLFMSAVDRLNDLRVRNFLYGDQQGNIHEYLDDRMGLFSTHELLLLENYFENFNGYNERRDRMQQLMELIIGTEGRGITVTDITRLKELAIATSQGAA